MVSQIELQIYVSEYKKYWYCIEWDEGSLMNFWMQTFIKIISWWKFKHF